MSTAKPQQMADQTDKSDDLISELAKLMASSAQGGAAAVRPITRPAPLSGAVGSSAPSPIRIPGMEPAQEPRGPSVGTFRIPGMDQPAPATRPLVTPPASTARASTLDFGRPPVAAPVTRADALAATPPSAPEVRPAARIEPSFAAARPSEAPNSGAVRIPAGASLAAEVKSAAPSGAPATPPAAPAAAPAAGGDFAFDFGFANKPPVASSAGHDPIADLIAAELDLPDGAPKSADPGQPAEKPPGSVNADARPIGLGARTAPASPSAPSAAPARPASPPGPLAPRVNLIPVTPGARPPSAAPIPVKPISVAPPESDRFAISPGIGLTAMPVIAAPPAPNSPRQGVVPLAEAVQGFGDPMSEIETLIGEAVRVEMAGGDKPSQVHQVQAARPTPSASDGLAGANPSHSPIVPPLTAQFAPRRTALRDSDSGIQSAEEAILAAAAASGAQVDRFDDGRLETGMADERVYKRIKVKAAKPGFVTGSMRQYVGMAVAGTLLLAAGLGLYWVLGMSRGGGDAAAPMLTADTTIAKVAPDPVAAPDAARSPVLDQIQGVTVNPDEQLVSTDQAEGDVARIIPAEPAAAPADSPSENGLANRKVRTVTVRPDGTIVSGDEAVAGGEALPVDRPNVPVVPDTEIVANTLLSADVPDASSDPIGQAITGGSLVADTAPPALDPAAVFDPTLQPPTVSARPVNREALAFSAPATATPEPLAAVATPTPVNALVTGGAMTPNGQIDLLAPAAPVSAPAASSGGAAAYVQLYSEGSEAEARNRIASAQSRYGSLFNGQELIVQRADLGQKGIKFRVRLPVGSLQEATQICAAIKANGGDCFATNG